MFSGNGLLGDFTPGNDQSIADEANNRWGLTGPSIAGLKKTHLRIIDEAAMNKKEKIENAKLVAEAKSKSAIKEQKKDKKK